MPIPRRKPFRVKLPSSLFILRYEGDARPPEGPWDPRECETQPDGSVALLSDGLPVVLKVSKQRGDKLVLDDGTVMFFDDAGKQASDYEISLTS